MKRPKVIHARAMCEAAGARGSIVLTFDHGAVQGVSYGETKAECAMLGATLDAIIADIMRGRTPVWDESRIAAFEAQYGTGAKE